MHKSLTLEIKKVMFYNFHRVPGHLLFDGGWNKGYLQGVFRGFYRCSFHVMVRAIYFVSSVPSREHIVMLVQWRVLLYPATYSLTC